MNDSHRAAVVYWLILCAAMVFATIILGGAVRLTGSGLSIVDWKPLLGTFPPLNHGAWIEAFDKYKQFPEYQIVNSDFSLSEFKYIFLMEYFHRLLGRLIGLVFFTPFVFFIVRRAIPPQLLGKLWALLLLGACQGLLGWYMVKSGLVDNPHVSQYRLTAHLLLAVVIYTWMLRLICGLLRKDSGATGAMRVQIPNLTIGSIALLVLVILMIATGGLMAGTKAGFIFNTWPKMGSELVPDLLWSISPEWKNLFENPLTIQFIHRWLAMIVLVSVLLFSIRVILLDPRTLNKWVALLAIIAGFTQVGLGIWTLLTKVPTVLGVAHQGVAMVLLTTVTIMMSTYLPGIFHGRAN